MKKRTSFNHSSYISTFAFETAYLMLLHILKRIGILDDPIDKTPTMGVTH